MAGDEKLMVCTMDRVPKRTVDTILGLAYGCCRVQGERSGKWHVKDGDRIWPWTEDPEHLESLFRIAETALRENARALGAEAVVGVRAQSDRDHSGRPGIFLVGTAVRFSVAPEEVVIPHGSDQTKTSEDPEQAMPQGIVSIAFEGKRGEWEPLEAVEKTKPQDTPSDEKASVITLADRLGISQERALALYQAGLRTVRDVAASNASDLARICGLNPTQARILLECARKEPEDQV